jgi:Calcium binding
LASYLQAKDERSTRVAKAKPARDEEREDRIIMEIVVDAYCSEERAMGWYYYLEGALQFPFPAKCIVKRGVSPLKVKDKVEVTGMADEEECQREMLVTIQWDDDKLAVPLSQLQPTTAADAETHQAIADWHYWVNMGYGF